MKKLLIILISLIPLFAICQKKDLRDLKKIISEGEMLYQSEMTSWYGTDLFLEKYKALDNVGGYFSYPLNGNFVCLFFSNNRIPKVLGTVTFDHTFSVETSKIDITKRSLSNLENDYYQIREAALNLIQSDTIFKTFENTSLNLIPIINNRKKKVYVLTGPKKGGVVVFGNDYLINFDSKNKVKNWKKLHNNIIPIYYEDLENEAISSMHSHNEETGDLITATDICTLMLYAKYANWKSHQVVTAKYLNIWNRESGKVQLVSMEAIKKIDQLEQENK